MKAAKTTYLKILIILTLTIVAFNCAPQSTEPEDNTVPFAKDPIATWNDANDPEHRVRIATNTGQEHGDITGYEIFDAAPNDTIPMTGSHNNLSIKFNFHRSSGVATFTGKFDTTGLNLIIRTANSHGDSLVLIQP